MKFSFTTFTHRNRPRLRTPQQHPCLKFPLPGRLEVSRTCEIFADPVFPSRNSNAFLIADAKLLFREEPASRAGSSWVTFHDYCVSMFEYDAADGVAKFFLQERKLVTIHEDCRCAGLFY